MFNIVTTPSPDDKENLPKLPLSKKKNIDITQLLSDLTLASFENIKITKDDMKNNVKLVVKISEMFSKTSKIRFHGQNKFTPSNFFPKSNYKLRILTTLFDQTRNRQPFVLTKKFIFFG